MSRTAVTDSLADHFKRAWGMVTRAVENFPEEEWLQGEARRMPPARIGYHLLQSTERYTWPGPAGDYESNRQFRLDWEDSPAGNLPTKAELLQHFECMKAKTLDWVRDHGDAGLTEGKPTWPWTGTNMLGQALYLLRHLQHHLGALNVELRRRGLPAAQWQ